MKAAASVAAVFTIAVLAVIGAATLLRWAYVSWKARKHDLPAPEFTLGAYRVDASKITAGSISADRIGDMRLDPQALGAAIRAELDTVREEEAAAARAAAENDRYAATLAETGWESVRAALGRPTNVGDLREGDRFRFLLDVGQTPYGDDVVWLVITDPEIPTFGWFTGFGGAPHDQRHMRLRTVDGSWESVWHVGTPITDHERPPADPVDDVIRAYGGYVATVTGCDDRMCERTSCEYARAES